MPVVPLPVVLVIIAVGKHSLVVPQDGARDEPARREVPPTAATATTRSRARLARRPTAAGAPLRALADNGRPEPGALLRGAVPGAGSRGRVSPLAVGSRRLRSGLRPRGGRRCGCGQLRSSRRLRCRGGRLRSSRWLRRSRWPRRSRLRSGHRLRRGGRRRCSRLGAGLWLCLGRQCRGSCRGMGKTPSQCPHTTCLTRRWRAVQIMAGLPLCPHCLVCPCRRGNAYRRHRCCWARRAGFLCLSSCGSAPVII
mmetsp:Transcript_88591/g.274360  ORF Transcript_88591/g.274360 Transcript_88591/m.274360 type:complete len:253 (-) Transcript_88591:144-902(-)